MKKIFYDDYFYSSDRVHLIQSLRKRDVTYLEEKGFKKVRKTTIYGKKKTYLVKRYEKESERHMILIWEAVRFLKRFTKDVQTFRSARPDIIFTFNKKHYAIEVETGITYLTNRNVLRKKVATLNEEFEDRWCFLLTNRNLKEKYSQYGITFDKRNFRKGMYQFLIDRKE